MSVPLFDCRVPAEGMAIVDAVLASGQLAAGANIDLLEAEISARTSGKAVVSVSNMTAALEIALRLAGVGPGDEVLTLAFNCLSSNSAIHNVGAVPVWVDVDPATAAMNVDDARNCIGPKTKALIVYHIAGYPADIAALASLAAAHGIPLIEDANAALGGKFPDQRPVGSVGDFAVFSFYANRQVNAIEGAALICPDQETADRARRLRRYGVESAGFRDSRGEIDPRSDVPEVGLSASMTNVNAALARSSLSTLDERLAQVRENAAALWRDLASVDGVDTMAVLGGADPAPWVFLLASDHRDAIVDSVRIEGFAASNLHQPNDVYSGFGASERALPGTRRLSSRMFAVPCGWWVSADQRSGLVDALQKAARTR